MNLLTVKLQPNGDIVTTNSGDLLKLLVSEDNGTYYFQFVMSGRVITAVGPEKGLKSQEFHNSTAQQFTIKAAGTL